jgi:hypothetical protein
MSAVVDFTAFFSALCKLYITLHLGLQTCDRFAQLTKVVVCEHTGTIATGTSSDHEAVAIACQVMEEPIIVRLSIHDVHDALVADPLRSMLSHEPPTIMFVVPASAAIACTAIPGSQASDSKRPSCPIVCDGQSNVREETLLWQWLAIFSSSLPVVTERDGGRVVYRQHGAFALTSSP